MTTENSMTIQDLKITLGKLARAEKARDYAKDKRDDAKAAMEATVEGQEFRAANESCSDKAADATVLRAEVKDLILKLAEQGTDNRDMPDSAGIRLRKEVAYRDGGERAAIEWALSNARVALKINLASLSPAAMGELFEWLGENHPGAFLINPHIFKEIVVSSIVPDSIAYVDAVPSATIGKGVSAWVNYY